MKRYIPLLISTLAILTLLTSCGGLKKSFGSSSYNKSYRETLSALYHVKKSDKVILLGAKHNYSFTHGIPIAQLLKNQRLLALNPKNFRLDIAVKEYQSSEITLTIFAHFEVSKLNKKQKSWLKEHKYPIELRAFGGKKTEPKPKKVPTYIVHIEHKGKREPKQTYQKATLLSSPISLEVSEHIRR